MRKILFLWPYHEKREPLPPLWALALGTYIKTRLPDVKIRILDEQITPAQIILNKIDGFKPDIVGISPSHAYYQSALKFARKAKSIGSRVVFGGAYATVVKQEILKNRGPYSNDYCVDVVIQRDGEKAFYEYVIGKPLSKINNLIYQTRTEIKENPIELLDLSRLPPPDRSLINLEEYFLKQGSVGAGGYNIKFLNIYAHRGCQWREKTGGCIFCCAVEQQFRSRSCAAVSQEINQLVSDYNINYIKIDGEDFLGNIKWFKNFAKYYKSSMAGKGFLPSLRISARIDRINAAIAKILHDINVRRIFIGFESGSQNLLKAIRKGTSLATVKKAVELLKRYQIGITGSFILGLPGETPETARNTLDLINELVSNDFRPGWNIQLQMFTPLQGSAAWQIFLKKTASTIESLFYGTLALSVIESIVAIVGFYLLGVSNPLIWGLAIFITAILPGIGPMFVWLPVTIIFIVQGDITQAIITAIFGSLIISTIIDTFLRIKILGYRAKINPVIMIIGVIGGVTAFGLIGVILGPLILSLLEVSASIYREIKHEA